MHIHTLPWTRALHAHIHTLIVTICTYTRILTYLRMFTLITYTYLLIRFVAVCNRDSTGSVGAPCCCPYGARSSWFVTHASSSHLYLSISSPSPLCLSSLPLLLLRSLAITRIQPPSVPLICLPAAYSSHTYASLSGPLCLAEAYAPRIHTLSFARYFSTTCFLPYTRPRSGCDTRDD